MNKFHSFIKLNMDIIDSDPTWFDYICKDGDDLVFVDTIDATAHGNFYKENVDRDTIEEYIMSEFKYMDSMEEVRVRYDIIQAVRVNDSDKYFVRWHKDLL